jgi:purine-cytosine permease-like protein
MDADLYDAALPETGDRFGRIEARGIDFIPPAERHGDARELFAVWAASNVTYLYIVLGGALIGLGLDVPQAIGVVVAGNLFWALVGMLAVSGPASGTPGSIVTRAMFGVRGNRVVVAITGWMISVAYEAINLSLGSLAGFALVESLGIHATVGWKLAVVLVTTIVTFAISVYGHATIVRLSGPFTILLTAGVAVLAAFVLPDVNLHFAPSRAPHGMALLAALFAGVTIMASGPLSWGTSADYARYLPAATSAPAVAWWTGLGGFLPSVLLGILGVLAGTAIDMTDPQTSFATILPGWFYPVFLLIVVVSSITNNVLTAYSSGLQLQAVGIDARRAITVSFDGVVGLGLTIYALFVSDFTDTLKNILELSVSLLGPSFAIYAVDILLRRNRYDGRALNDESPLSRFWFRRGFNEAGIIALLAGTIAALLCANTTMWVGPVARALDGADISTLTGPLVGAIVYAVANSRTNIGESAIREIGP